MPRWIDVHGTPQSVAARLPHPYSVEPKPRVPKPKKAKRPKRPKRKGEAAQKAYEAFFYLQGFPHPTTGCMEWRGLKRQDGYGVLFVGQRRVSAHRYSFQTYNNVQLQPHQFVCHRCDNPPCVNPAHLFVGSAKDNAADMIAKGRAGWQKKQRAHQAVESPSPSLPATAPRLVKRRPPSVSSPAS
jgi:hypothetical protein